MPGSSPANHRAPVPPSTRKLFLLPLLLVAFACTALSGAARAERLSVVATFSIVGDWVHNVADDLVDLSVLVGPDSDTHTYEPAPRDMITLASADLLFENGVGLETWLDKMYTASGSTATRVAVTDGVELIGATDDEHEHDHDHDEHEHGDDDHEGPGHAHDHEGPGHAHHHGELDPHTWQDVSNAMAGVALIRDALANADPGNAEAYAANATAYLTELAELDAAIKSAVAALPEDQRAIVTNHDAFAYFARAYGFEIVGSLIPLSTDAGDVSARAFAALVDSVRASGASVVFLENVANDALARRIASETGIRVSPSLYSDALGAPGSDGDSYIKMMHHNVRAVLQALAPTEAQPSP